MKQKLLCTFLLGAVMYSISFAQTSYPQKSLGGSGEDYLGNWWFTKDSDVVIAGSSASGISGVKTQISRGKYDYWVVKMSKFGKIQWDKTLGGKSGEEANSIVQTADGGFIVAGGSSSNISGEKTQNDYSKEFDFWIVKLDAAGNVQWDKTIGGTGYDDPYSIRQTPDKGYIIAGYSNSPISGNKTANPVGLGDLWLVKTDSLGNVQWDKTIGSNDNEIFGGAMLPTKDGGYLIGEYSIGNISGNKTQDSRGGYDYWLVKVDSSGNVQWDKTIGGDGDDYLYSIQPAHNGGYILAGASISGISGEKTTANLGSYDCWLVKTDSLGNIQWDKSYGGSGDDRILNVGRTKDGGYILGGESTSDISASKSENSRGGYDYWVIKTDSAGNELWNKTIGGSSDDYATGIRETSNGNYLMLGFSYSPVSGDKKSVQYGAGDYWLVRLNDKGQMIQSTEKTNDVIASLSAKTTNKFTAYPNPARDYITIQSPVTAVFTLTSGSGKTVITQSINNTGVMDVKQLPAGVYILTNLSTGLNQKIVITR